MYKSVLIFYCLTVISSAHAQTPISEIELIEFLGEFDQEDNVLLEASIDAANQPNTTDENEAEQTGASNEQTAE